MCVCVCVCVSVLGWIRSDELKKKKNQNPVQHLTQNKIPTHEEPN